MIIDGTGLKIFDLNAQAQRMQQRVRELDERKHNAIRVEIDSSDIEILDENEYNIIQDFRNEWKTGNRLAWQKLSEKYDMEIMAAYANSSPDLA